MTSREEEIVRVIRVLEVQGPREWVEQTLRDSYVHPSSPYRWGNQVVREISRSVAEVVK